MMEIIKMESCHVAAVAAIVAVLVHLCKKADEHPAERSFL